MDWENGIWATVARNICQIIGVHYILSRVVHDNFIFHPVAIVVCVLVFVFVVVVVVVVFVDIVCFSLFSCICCCCVGCQCLHCCAFIFVVLFLLSSLSSSSRMSSLSLLNCYSYNLFQGFHLLQRSMERSRRPPSPLHWGKLHRHPGKPWLRLPPRRSHPAWGCRQMEHRYLCRPGGRSTGSKGRARGTPSRCSPC